MQRCYFSQNKLNIIFNIIKIVQPVGPSRSISLEYWGNEIFMKKKNSELRKCEPSNGLGKRIWKNRSVYLMILPIFIWFLVFSYWPLTWLRMAFYDFKLRKGFAGSEFVGWENFINFFTKNDAVGLIVNTLAINVWALIILFPAPIILALLFSELRFPRFKKTIQTISYMPHFMSTVMLVSFINILLSPSLGLIGRIFTFLGLEPIYFLGDPKYFRPIQVLSGLWQTVGWNSIVYVAAISGIDPQLYEAARLDGASRFQQIMKITLPCLLPTIVTMLLMQLGLILGSNFEKILLMQNDFNLEVSEVIQTFVYKRALQRGDYGLSTAAGLFNSVVSLVIVIISNRVTKKLTETSLW